MLRRVFSVVMFILLVTSMLTLAFNIQPVKASGTIYIRADGSIDPSGAPILRKGDLYTLTDDIFSDSEYGIVIERDNMTLDGAGHIAQGNGSSFEIYLFEIGNVTVQDVQIKTSLYGIFLKGASNCSICRNNITDNGMYGIALDWSYYNCIVGNNIENNDVGIFLYLRDSDYNTIYHNNIVNNIEPVLLNPPGTPFVAWDNGYPSGGNYWSDYTGTDLHSGPYQNETGSDGIGDTQYSIDSHNTDRYPLMNLWVSTRLLGDINGDRVVNIFDAILLANAYNSTPGKANWNPNADINGDSIVNIFDAIILSNHYNQHYP